MRRPRIALRQLLLLVALCAMVPGYCRAVSFSRSQLVQWIIVELQNECRAIQAMLCGDLRSRIPKRFWNSFTQHTCLSPSDETLSETRKRCWHFGTLSSTRGASSQVKWKATTLVNPRPRFRHACCKGTNCHPKRPSSALANYQPCIDLRTGRRRKRYRRTG